MVVKGDAALVFKNDFSLDFSVVCFEDGVRFRLGFPTQDDLKVRCFGAICDVVIGCFLLLGQGVL